VTGETVAAGYVGAYNVTVADNTTATVNIVADSAVYQYCSQNWLGSNKFPAIPTSIEDGQEWMTESQNFWSFVYGWTSVAVITLVVLTFLRQTVYKSIRAYYFSPYKVRDHFAI